MRERSVSVYNFVIISITSSLLKTTKISNNSKEKENQNVIYIGFFGLILVRPRVASWSNYQVFDFGIKDKDFWGGI